jgi:hypothetical protein
MAVHNFAERANPAKQAKAGAVSSVLPNRASEKLKKAAQKRGAQDEFSLHCLQCQDKQF